ncbi:MAG TPA: hypothetical protein VFR19_04230 [Hyphomicrobiaceae bacterium]|jgi:hypothetical protein|nr:hypothetical protein [Hyphomicrobiaceae bacterium]
MHRSPALPIVLVALALVAFGPGGTPAGANRINTGAADGPYQKHFCGVLAQQLKLAQFDFACEPTAGPRETVERVLADPRQLGYAQLDAFAFLANELKAETAFTVVRHDDVRQCLYAVTRNPQLTNWGELSANARQLRLVLPPADSDSASSFQFLRAIDPAGLGKTQEVRHAPSIESAIREGLSAEDTVSLFVQFPDPDSERFALIQELGGHVVPVIDRAILRQEALGKKVYFAQETQVENPQWIKSARRIVTACTPVLVFTGTADRVAGDKARKDHEDLIRTIGALKGAALLPEEGLFSKLLKRSKELTAASTEKLLAATEQAREKARPYTDKAMEAAKEGAEQAKGAAERASDAAKPYVDKSKEAAQKAYDEAMKMAKELLEKKPQSPPKND